MMNALTKDFTLVLGIRHITVVLFLAVILLGSFSAMAYIVGRAVMPPAVPLDGSEEPEKVLIVDPAGQETHAPAPALEPKPGAEPVDAAFRPAPKTVMAGFQAETYFREPNPGQLFLQVAAADRGVAEVFAEYLTRKSFPCQIAAGPNQRSYRVLVGPIQDKTQLGRLKTGLETSGFNPFLRRYKAN